MNGNWNDDNFFICESYCNQMPPKVLSHKGVKKLDGHYDLTWFPHSLNLRDSLSLLLTI